MSSKIPEQAPAAVPEEVQSSEEEFVDDNKQGEELDEAMQERLQEIFQLFDFDLDGHIQTVELGTIIRGLDFNLTEKQIMSLINKYDDTGSGKLNYPTFYNLMRDNQPMMSPITEEGVLESFKAFDIGGVHPGFIPAVDLVQMLREKGEPMPQEDVDNLLCEITIDGDNRIGIAEFVQHMIQTSS